MKQMTEAKLKELLQRAYRMGWRTAMTPIDNVPSALIGCNANPDDLIDEVDNLVKEV